MEITKQSSRKRQKLISGENPDDRLSSLPDDIICHNILSLLPTKRSFSTSILAKRWRFLWAHVPDLDFDCKNHTLSISNIINRFVSLQRLNILRLSIKNSNNYELECVLPPPRLFTCKALVDLSLCCSGTIPINGATTVCLPALKKLSLDRVKYESKESLPRLLSGCPVLEELTIRREGNKDNMICCYISSPTLKRLLLSSRCFDEYKGFKVKLEDSVSEYLSAGALTSLTEAFLDFCAPMTLAKARSVLEFVSRLCNVDYLNLQTEEMTRVSDSEFYVFTIKFRNLVKLELEADWRLITKLLEIADNLQVLVINACESDLKGWMDPKQVPACLISRLGSVRIDYFGCTEDELNLVRYILRNAKVLERMYIHTYRKGHVYKRIDSKRKNEVSERISLFDRGSEACEVAFD